MGSGALPLHPAQETFCKKFLVYLQKLSSYGLVLVITYTVGRGLCSRRSRKGANTALLRARCNPKPPLCKGRWHGNAVTDEVFPNANQLLIHRLRRSPFSHRRRLKETAISYSVGVGASTTQNKREADSLPYRDRTFAFVGEDIIFPQEQAGAASRSPTEYNYNPPQTRRGRRSEAARA